MDPAEPEEKTPEKESLEERIASLEARVRALEGALFEVEPPDVEDF